MSQMHPLSGRRVLFFLCGFDLGGAERQALHLARHLKSVGAHVQVWGHHHEHPGPERVIEECESAGIPWAEYRFRWPCGSVALARDAFRLWRGLCRERPEIILSYTTWPNIGCGLVWQMSPAGAFIWGQRDLAPFGNHWVERFAYRGASAVVCNASHEITHLEQSMGKTRSPVHVVHNGIELAPPQKTRSQWRAELGVPENAVVATMLANFRADKDHATLLCAWRKAVDSATEFGGRLYLVLAGAQQEAFKNAQAMISELSLGENVCLPGQIEDVAGFLSACDIGILSSRAEGLPNAILEYMACGLPLVVTDIPGNREALGENAVGQLCRAGDADDLAHKLQELIRDPDLRRKYGDLNRRHAEAEFSIKIMCEKMTDIIGGIMHPSKT